MFQYVYHTLEVLARQSRVLFPISVSVPLNPVVSENSVQNAAAHDDDLESVPVAFDGAAGSFVIAPTDKTGRDFRARGRLDYAGRRYLRFAETGEYFIKGGADSPENFLAYFEFDGTYSRKRPGSDPKPGEARPMPFFRLRAGRRTLISNPGQGSTWFHGKIPASAANFRLAVWPESSDLAELLLACRRAKSTGTGSSS